MMAGPLTAARKFLIAAVGVALFLGFSIDAAAQKKTSKKQQEAKKKQEDLANSPEPDKVLYDRALDDLKHSRYTEGRLALQTLINTYPDSEYLAKAKLAIADSYYKEGGTSNLTQAISEYKDFETFFPFLDEAAYAQMQVGMAHYKMMEKADRDTSQAQFAEDELQAMLLKYPQSPLAPKAEQRLREVQEVLADGQFRIAKFYYSKQDTRAAGARILEITERYPLYSQADEAYWMMADIYMKTKQTTKDEDARNVWAEQAARCYYRIAREYPLSKRAPEAKVRLKSMGQQPPDPDPNALARMQKEQAYAKEHHSTLAGFVNSPLGMLKTGPDVSAAAHSGAPNLTPPSDTFAATEVLKPGGSNSISGRAIGPGSSEGGRSASPQRGQASPAPPATDSTQDMHAGVQILTPQAEPAAPLTNSSSSVTAPPPANAAPVTAAPPPSAPGATDASATASTGSNAAPAAQGATTDQGSNAAADGASSTPAAADQPGLKSTPQATDPKDESTSKKKKGLRKMVPW
jgi:outer membrane protein assembly factor BamD